MIGLGDVTVIESVRLTNGLDGRCEGKRGIKDASSSLWLDGMVVPFTEVEQVGEK